MSNKDKKKAVSLTKPVTTPAPDYKSAEEKKEPVKVDEVTENKPVVKLEKPKSVTKTPKVVEVIPDANGVVVSFNSKSASAPVKQPEGSISDRAARFNRMALGNRWTNRNALINLAIELLGSNVAVYEGKSKIEIYFEIEGVRLPSEGVYFIR